MDIVCQVCNNKMEEIKSGNNTYWFCKNCGNIIKPKNKRVKVVLPKEDLSIAIKKSVKDRFGLDIDSLDWDYKSYIDSSLTLEENLKIIEENLRNLIPDLKFEVDEDEVEHFENEVRRKEEEHYKKEFEKRINEIKNSNIVELEQYFKNYYEHIETFLKNDRINGFFVVGNAGIGKTFNLIKKLNEKGLKFEIIKGHHTNLSFYKTLYENRENSILIIDDVVSLAQDKEKISLLLGALDDSKLVIWNSSSPLTSDLPRSFMFNSKIFILANEFNESNEFLKALKDRCIFYELKFSREQIIEMLYILAKKRNYSLELVDYLKELSENSFIKNLSLRLLDKLYPYCNNGYDWKSLIKEIIEVDEIENLVYELMKSGKSVKEQVKEFIEKTGLSRRTYFYIKAKLKEKIGAKVQK